MPVYNAEKFLDISIPSVLNQDYRNIELILVNDGSTDNSLEICKKYADSDKRIVLINQENKGIAGARNNGLETAKGEYITFIDNDDWVDKDIYTYLINILDNSDVAFAECGINIVYDNRIETFSKNREIYCNIDDALEYFFDENNLFRWTVWNKVFRRSLVKDIRFKWGLAEDMRFDLEVFKLGSIFFSSDIPKYNWNRQNYISESRKGFDARQTAYLDFFMEFESLSKEKALFDLADRCYAEVCKRILSYSARVNMKKIENYKDYLFKWKKFARRNLTKTLKCNHLSFMIKADFLIYCVIPHIMNKINIKFVNVY